jgi:hypothetical protein
MKSISIPIKSTSVEQRVRLYLDTLHKWHSLRDKEIDILVELILKYYEIVNKYPVHDDLLINKLLFDIDVKKNIKVKFNMKDGVLHNYLTILRKKGALKDKGINPSYIPPKESFELKLVFL